MTTVYVATIEHKHGTNTYAAETYALARGAVADYCREWWPDRGMEGTPETPDGMSDDDVIDAYFDCGGDYEVFNGESFNIEEHEIIRAKVTA